MFDIKEDVYAKELLNKVNELKSGLEYYIRAYTFVRK